MAKAVLVMDMPERCMNCNLMEGRYVHYCNMAKRDIDVNCYHGKPDWCPLKPLPEKKERLVATNDYDGGYSHGFTHGYNSCLGTIGGDT